MSWEQACKLLQHDPRFKVVPKISEKKQVFNSWKIQRAKEEKVTRLHCDVVPPLRCIELIIKDEKRLAIKKGKEDLEKWLMANPKMTTTMSYSKAATVFAQ